MELNEKNIDESRYLAIDYGLRRIGLALTDPLKLFAYPFDTINNDNKLWENLKRIIKGKNIVRIILGNPLKESGEESAMSLKVMDFKNHLEKKFNIQIILWDERYTSSLAKESILESVTKKKKRRDKGLVDRNAAAIMLKEYLESN